MRRKDREVTDPAAIRQILDSAKVMYMGLSDLGEPYVVPLNYGYTLENGILTLYFHSAPAGRKMESLKENPADSRARAVRPAPTAMPSPRSWGRAAPPC